MDLIFRGCSPNMPVRFRGRGQARTAGGGKEVAAVNREGQHKDGPLKDRYRRGFVEVVCPKCRTTRIIVVPEEPMPRCENCRVEMIVKEVLTEGKY